MMRSWSKMVSRTRYLLLRTQVRQEGGFCFIKVKSRLRSFWQNERSVRASDLVASCWKKECEIGT